MSDEKNALSDYSEIFQENYDKIDDERSELSKFFADVNTWLFKKIPVDLFDKDHQYLMYQYLESSQPEFMRFQSRLSAITKAVYLVVKDVNEITQTGTKAYQDSNFVRKEGDPETPQKQVISVNTGRPSIFHRLFNKQPDTNLPKSLEDAWIKSENWKEEVLNIPKIWGKYVVWHHYGVRWQKEFDGYGMEDYRDNEASYLNTRVELPISSIVSRALEIRTGSETEKLERIYTSTQQAEKEMEMQRMMTNQDTSTPKSA